MDKKEINKLVIEKFLGWKIINEEYSVVQIDHFPQEFRPCEDIEDAFTIWKKLNEKGYFVDVEQESDFEFVVYIKDGYYEETICFSDSVEDKNFPMAMSKAALKTVGISI